jgi:hypothetical protein
MQCTYNVTVRRVHETIVAVEKQEVFQLYNFEHQVSSCSVLSTETEMGRTCGTYGGEGRWIQGFSGKTWGKETTWKTQA